MQNNIFFICETNQIINEIEKAKGIILNRNMNDIWSALLIEVKESNLTIKSTDRNIFFESTIQIVSEADFKVLINASNFYDAVKAFSFYKKIKIVFNESNSKLEIMGESKNEKEEEYEDHLNEPTFSYEEIENYNYDMINEDCIFEIEVKQKFLKKVINRIAFSAHIDESKNVLNGVYFTKDEDSRLLLVSTNGHRMSICKTEVVVEENVNFIVPVKIFNFLKHLMSGEGMVKIKSSDKKFYVEFDNYKIACSLINGNYPDYKSIIPKDQKNKSLVSLGILKDRLARVNLYVDKSRKLVLTFSEFQLRLLGEDLITGRKGEFFIKNSNYLYDGTDEVVAINISYFVEAISVFETSKIEIQFNSGNVLKLSEPENLNFTHLIMPMSLG
ncbi:DNA polymerase III subunit beta [Borreliella lusitaniae]|uniref:Beta sliding clamp n=1 Tax=Borreliella lusitaniae TaxID=100177 RepID=A0ABZ0CHG0_9SPIR|nr:DNA polymerase III subunit beta [Borreliella lusitaniae]WKC85350.1 DNA polymerase III subunit beta [Borreliella lusitaniae]WNY68639.1 DNA polymerase III subunit beta [Borreliella lusitaniae]